MPLRLIAGISKKTGLPNYGSLGAICQVEVDLDGPLIFQDLETFHRHVRSAYVACSQAVNDELARHRAAMAGPPTQPATDASSSPPDEAPWDIDEAASEPADRGSDNDGPSHNHSHPQNGGNGGGSGVGDGHGNGSGNGQRASGRQVDFARALAGQIRGLGFRRLDPVCCALFGRPMAELSATEASRLIDSLKDIRAGKMPVEQLLEELAT